MSLSPKNVSFLSILRGGLWEQDNLSLPNEIISFEDLFRLSQEQSVIGLITAGLEKRDGITARKEDIFEFVAAALRIEQRNLSMNDFIESLIGGLQKTNVGVVLVKGQGIAQCYEKPLWRSSGDIDLLVDDNSFYKVSQIMSLKANYIDKVRPSIMHLAMTIGPWEIELHGTMRSQLGRRIDKEIDDVQRDIFKNNHVRVWQIGKVDIPLPSPDNDVFLVFTHILQHFFQGGIGLRQICDWVRLIWTYHDTLDIPLLEDRLDNAGIMTEWKVFSSLAVDYLGMSDKYMPLFSTDSRYKKKAEKVLSLIFETGSFGNNRDNSYLKKYPFLLRKCVSLYRISKDCFSCFKIFPLTTVRAWSGMIVRGIRNVVK